MSSIEQETEVSRCISRALGAAGSGPAAQVRVEASSVVGGLAVWGFPSPVKGSGVGA